MPAHEFGITNVFNPQKGYGYYAPEEYNCIAVDDELINELSKSIKIMKSYFHYFYKPEFGLAYCGVTIIPLESLSVFYDVVVSFVNVKESGELSNLAEKIVQAREEYKYMKFWGLMFIQLNGSISAKAAGMLFLIFGTNKRK